MIRLSETTVKLSAGESRKLTAVAAVKCLPLIFTSAPADPVEGENDFTEGDGAGTIAKAEVLASAPPGVSTTIGPLVVPAATTAVIFESELTVKLAAVVVLNRTAVAPVNPAPLTTTETPAQPFVGLKPLTAGTAAPAADGETTSSAPSTTAAIQARRGTVNPSPLTSVRSNPLSALDVKALLRRQLAA
jgi:hypothetical protein